MKDSPPRITVLGAGPIGLEAALYARKLGFSVTVFERGRVGEHVLRWGHVRMFSPFGMNTTPLGKTTIRQDAPDHEFPQDNAGLSASEYHAAYLQPLASCLKECLKLDTTVLKISRTGMLKEHSPGDPKRARQPFRILVREGKNRERIEQADVVLDCTGTFGQHRWLGDGGIPAIGEMAAEPQIPYGLENILGDRRQAYAGKTVMVVGGGYSAATTVCNLATLAEQQPDTWVIWLARCQSTQPISRLPNDPLRERDRLAVRANTLATRGDGNVEFHNQSAIDALEFLGPDKGFKVTALCSGKPRTWDVDRLIANVGYSPDTALYRELQVQECYASLGPAGVAAQLSHGTADTQATAKAVRNPEPNFFILGAKSFGRNSSFLLPTGFEQVRDAFALIADKPALDLYQGSQER